MFFSVTVLVFIAGIMSQPYIHSQWRGYEAKQAVDIVQRGITRCSASDNRLTRVSCLRSALESAVRRFGIRGSMDALRTFMVGYGGGSGIEVANCHDIAHVIGKIGVQSTHNAKSSLSQCTNLCGDGCFHGVVEGFLASGGNMQDASETLCDPADTSCFHGLGHGIATTVGELHKSLKYCDHVVSEAGKEQCGYGVLMELYESSTFGHEVLQLPSDVVGFCNDLGGIYKEVCLSKAGIHEYTRTKDVVSAGAVCAKVPGTSHCLNLLGVLIFWQFQDSPSGLVDACEKTGPDRWQECVRGAVLESVNIDPLARQGFAICALVLGVYAPRCYETLGKSIESTDGLSERRRLCSQAPGDGARFCSTDTL